MTLLALGCILLKMLSDVVVGRRFGEFAALCESSSSVELQAREVEELFNRYDCTQATGPHDDDTMHVGEWLDTRLVSAATVGLGCDCCRL
eukprot:COSAG04_NODE_170_length_21634_cov_12.250337_10_plen_90_part_00